MRPSGTFPARLVSIILFLLATVGVGVPLVLAFSMGPCGFDKTAGTCLTCNNSGNTFQCLLSGPTISGYTPDEVCLNMNADACTATYYNCGLEYDCNDPAMYTGHLCSQGFQCKSP